MIGRKLRLGLAAAAPVALALIAAPSWGGLPARWSPLGPALVLDGPAWPGRVPVTGRINVVAPNPENPLGDIWIGSAGGGAWRGRLSPEVFWRPMTDGAPSLAVGDIQLDSCSEKRCETVWIGTGENGIRRDTQHGRGVLKGTWKPIAGDPEHYDWELLGKEHFSYGSISRLLLDPSTADGPAKRLYVALSSGTISNATHSTFTTFPKDDMGIWRSQDAGESWENVLDPGSQATDLEMDPQQPEILFAGFRGLGLFRSEDGGDSWDPIVSGIPQAVIEDADWPELAVYRAPSEPRALLYAVLGACPHPHEKESGALTHCSPAVYRSDDSGDSWSEVTPAMSPPPGPGEPLAAYTSYTHALTIHPTDPDQLWFGGVNLYRSANGGQSWQTVGSRKLPANHHQVVIVPTKEMPKGYAFYDASDGGFFVGDGEEAWNGTFQHGLEVALFQSVSSLGSTPFGGAHGHGTDFFLGTEVWLHSGDGGAASTLADLDDTDTFYSTSAAVTPRRCTLPDLCPFTWQGIAGDPALPGALPESRHVSWYPPFVQDPNPVKGERPLYFAARDLFRNAGDGGDPASAPGWTQVTPSGLGGPSAISELGGILDPITAVAVAPSTSERVYVGYYEGKLFTSANALSPNPLWVTASSGLPQRPVSAIAVSPTDDSVVLAAFEGFGAHALYLSTNAGQSWVPFDDALDSSFHERPIHALAIEPTSPTKVWAGTEDGVHTRDGLTPGGDLFAKTLGLPNVPVYDLELAPGGTLLAATHGRGVWMHAAEPRIEARLEGCCGYFSTYFPKPFIAVSGAGFEPNQSCTMTLVSGAGTCGSSSQDLHGADLHTDSRGFLVSTSPGNFWNRQVSWACYEGYCIGGSTYSACPVTGVTVSCGAYQAAAPVQMPQETENPTSTFLWFTPSESGGDLWVKPMVKRNGGLSQTICEVRVFYSPGEGEQSVLERLVEALNSNSDCGRASLEAYLVGGAAAGLREGEVPTPIRLALRAPWVQALQLVTEVRLTGAGRVGVSSFGDRLRGTEVVPRITLGGTASGGRVTFHVASPLGSYSLGVDTDPGATATSVSSKIFDGMTGRDTGGGLPIGGTGGPPKKPFAAFQAGVMIDLPHLLAVEVESTDLGLTVTIGSGL